MEENPAARSVPCGGRISSTSFSPAPQPRPQEVASVSLVLCVAAVPRRPRLCLSVRTHAERALKPCAPETGTDLHGNEVRSQPGQPECKLIGRTWRSLWGLSGNEGDGAPWPCGWQPSLCLEIVSTGAQGTVGTGGHLRGTAAEATSSRLGALCPWPACAGVSTEPSGRRGCRGAGA